METVATDGKSPIFYLRSSTNIIFNRQKHYSSHLYISILSSGVCKYNPYRDNSFSTTYGTLNIDGIRSLFIIYKLPGIEVNIKRCELNMLA